MFQTQPSEQNPSVTEDSHEESQAPHRMASNMAASVVSPSQLDDSSRLHATQASHTQSIEVEYLIPHARSYNEKQWSNSMCRF